MSTLQTLESAPLLCGPSGWTHSHWDTLVYPQPKPRGFHSLAYLARYFSTIEISASFSEDLKPEVTRVWLHKVADNPDFQFTAKLHRRFTHERNLDPALVAVWKEGMLPVLRAGRLGALLMQFPWSFRYTEENREFLIRLRRTFKEFPLVVEMRHASWSADEALGTLVDYHIGFCNIDQPRYTKAMPPTSFLTSPIGYVRLHGRNCRNWFQQESPAGPVAHRYDYLYSESELAEWRARVDRIRPHARRVFVVMNNDAGAKSLVNALQFQTLITGQAVEVPRALQRHFRDSQQTATPLPVQRTMFEEYHGRAVA